MTSKNLIHSIFRRDYQTKEWTEGDAEFYLEVPEKSNYYLTGFQSEYIEDGEDGNLHDRRFKFFFGENNKIQFDRGSNTVAATEMPSK